MAPRIADRLVQLSAEEAAVLYWWCRGENEKQISRNRRVLRSGSSPSKETIRNILLGVHGTMRPYDIKDPGTKLEIVDEIERLVGSPPVFTRWPPELPKEPPPPPPRTGREIILYRPPPLPPPEPRRRSIWPYALLILLIGLVASAYWFLIREEPPPETAAATITLHVPTPEITPSTPSPETVEPTATELIDVAATAEEGTAAVIINVTNTAIREAATQSAMLTQSAPTNTPRPTDTPRPTIAPTPTQDVMNLTVGDTLKDNRVQLVLKERVFNHRFIYATDWAVGFLFEFTNLSGDDLILIVEEGDVRAVDNLGIEYRCDYPAPPYNHLEFTATLAHGAEYGRWIACGVDKIFGRDVTQIELFIDSWSSLPPSRWVIEVPH